MTVEEFEYLEQSSKEWETGRVDEQLILGEEERLYYEYE